MPKNIYGLPFRQVHLDFHTSEKIADIAGDFNANDFVDTLVQARVNSVTCFARCHHGWLYYDSKVFPERIHPHLKNKNLLKDQIEICHERGIRTPIYITVQWDHATAMQHPEWLTITEKGSWHSPGSNLSPSPYEAGFYRTLCLNSPYRDFLKEIVKDVFDSVSVDGLFFDIVVPQDCSCRYCRKDMETCGIDLTCANSRMEYATSMIDGFKLDMTNYVRQFSKNCSVFYNSGHIGPLVKKTLAANSHLEIESLPSGDWGYMHFPVVSRYARNLNLDCVGHTGKFHTTWGDFHSFKNPAALQFECFMMLALNSKCLIGDQLHPSGKICKDTYKLIGTVYAEVEKKEPWCKDAIPVTEVGVLTPEEFTIFNNTFKLPESIIGATRMLQERAYQFDIIDTSMDFSRYKVIILPDNIPVSPAIANKLKTFVSAGGSLIASYESGLDKEKKEFSLTSLGVELKGLAPYSPDFVLPEGPIGKGLARTEYVMYLQGMEVGVQEKAVVLSNSIVPYFNRSYKHFCSHLHTPSSHKSGYPAVVQNDRAIYFAHPIFTIYDKKGAYWCKKMFFNALDILLDKPLIKIKGPSTIVATINNQKAEKRFVLHLLHDIPQRRCQELDVIEDVIPLHDVEVLLNLKKKIENVRCVPESKFLNFKQNDNHIEFILSPLKGHQMIEISY